MEDCGFDSGTVAGNREFASRTPVATGDLELEPSTSAGGDNFGSRTRTTMVVGDSEFGPISTLSSSLAPESSRVNKEKTFSSSLALESSRNNKEKKAFSFDIFFVFFLGGGIAN